MLQSICRAGEFDWIKKTKTTNQSLSQIWKMKPTQNYSAKIISKHARAHTPKWSHIANAPKWWSFTAQCSRLFWITTGYSIAGDTTRELERETKCTTFNKSIRVHSCHFFRGLLSLMYSMMFTQIFRSTRMVLWISQNVYERDVNSVVSACGFSFMLSFRY